jgi:hypothetical protein
MNLKEKNQEINKEIDEKRIKEDEQLNKEICKEIE